MPPIAKFTVKSPACAPQPPGGPVPGPTASYQGTAISDAAFSPKFGNATVVGGTRMGKRWVGCRYTAPPYVIPGVGDVDIV